MLHPTKIDIPEDKRIDLIALLQGALTEAIDLKLQSKQAHWNVRGPNFIALHELFDQVAGIVEGFADEIAERITTLGGVANGIVGFIASKPIFPSIPPNWSVVPNMLKLCRPPWRRLRN